MLVKIADSTDFPAKKGLLVLVSGVGMWLNNDNKHNQEG